MRLLYFISAWLALWPVCAAAQSVGKNGVFLVVVNEQRHAVSGATVKLLQDGKVAGSAAAGEDGSVALICSEGTYKLLISATGYRPLTTGEYQVRGRVSDTVVMHAVQDLLTQVTVTGRTPPVERRRDKTIVNVEASITNTGATVAEVLERSPGVTMDKNGNIALNGKQGVLVMIDDKPTYLSGDDLNNLLTSMSASQVSKIELISSPSARYDAAGNAGIINIKTKKSRNDGFNGNFTTTYGQGVYPKYSNSLVLNYRKGRVNSFFNYSLNDLRTFSDLYADRKYYDDSKNLTAILRQPTTFFRSIVNHTIKTGLDYSVTPKTMVGLVLTGTDNRRNGKSVASADWLQPDETMDSSILTLSNSKYLFQNEAVNLNARHALSSTVDLSADVDYLHYRMKTSQDFDNQLQAPGGYDEVFRSNIPTTINIFSGKLDAVMRLSPDITLQAGGKTSSSHTDNAAVYENLVNQQWVKDDTRSNHFVYQENIQALYTSLEGRTGRWTYEGGVRYEYTGYTARQSGNSQQHDSTVSRNYASFFPNASASYKLDSLNSLTLTIGRRTDRPVYQILNPFVYVINKYTYQTGNPYILPQYTWNFELGHQYGDLLTTSISYSYTTNYFSQIFLSDTSKTILYYTQGNVSHVYNLGVSASLNITPVPWWTAQLTAVFNHKQLRGFNGNEYTSEISQLHLNVNNQLSFGNGFTGEISGFYTTRSRVDVQELQYPVGQLAAGVSKSILKKKGSLKFNCRNIFYGAIMEGFTSFPSATEYFKILVDTRVLSLTFTYRFGGSFKTSRHEGGAGDEKERVQNG